MKEHIEASLNESIRVRRLLLENQLEEIERFVRMIIETYRQGGKVIFMGNGGSAADAQHLSGELVGRFHSNRKALPSLSLSTDTSILTCIGNDYGFESLFSRQIEAWGAPGDLVVGITTSGNSPNVLEGIRKAKAMGIATVGLTGGTGGKLASAADFCLIMPSADTARIQELHITLGHIACELLDEELFGV
ncbi:MAG: D-sedoheptulose 7-phosphate isomerase [Armatimonadetes bacterium]|nr:D-sedoheptulose 7-phosphate isomerase [Armatimonadota bacterium]